MTAPRPQLNELGFYTLPGAPRSPRDLIREVGDAEELGLGACFISERFNIKEAVTLSGAVGAVSTNLGIATAATNHNTRHPLVTASYATTMHRLTGGRFTLGIGRGVGPLYRAYGLPMVTTAQMEDFAGLMRRLFRGEVIIGHDGPIGKYPVLALDPTSRRTSLWESPPSALAPSSWRDGFSTASSCTPSSPTRRPGDASGP